MSVNKKKQKIEVLSSSVIVVPFNKSISFFSQEIASEGNLRDNVPLIFLFPDSRRGEATTEAIREIFADLQKIRERQLPVTRNFEGNHVDVGLIDIQVFFSGDESAIKSQLKDNANSFLQANLKQLDLILGENYKEYMLTVTEQNFMIVALHCFAPDGTFQLKYHNVIFNLLKNGSKLKYLNIHLLLSDLVQKGKKISLIG